MGRGGGGGGFFTIREILFVSEHEEQAILHLAIVDNPVQLLLGLLDTRAVRRVNDKNETLGT